jgi:hypothetical protein
MRFIPLLTRFALDWFWFLCWFSSKISWRFGRSYTCRPEHGERVKPLLKPGMIVLSKRKYEFSGLFIPGYWKHSAIVACDGEIIEATVKGVDRKGIADYFHFVDEFAVLQPTFCNEEVMASAARFARERIGSPYSYDLSNIKEKYYCSGLVYRAYLESIPRKTKVDGFPYNAKEFFSGRIVRPNDFFTSRKAWEVVYSTVKNSDGVRGTRQ